MMNTRELKARREKLEKDLTRLLFERIDEFRMETGLSVKSVDVRFARVGLIGMRDEYALAGVVVEVDV